MIFSAQTSRWQTVIADLSLILFLVAASALETQPDAPEETQDAAQETAMPREPIDIALTVWSDSSGGASLADWLAEQTPDDRQRLSITITYRAGGLDDAIARAAQIRAISAVQPVSIRTGAGAEPSPMAGTDARTDAGTDAGANARILIAQGQRDSVQVRLVQDTPERATGPDVAS